MLATLTTKNNVGFKVLPNDTLTFVQDVRSSDQMLNAVPQHHSRLPLLAVLRFYQEYSNNANNAQVILLFFVKSKKKKLVWDSNGEPVQKWV